MRKIMISALLAASVAMPAMAQDDNGGRRDRVTSEQREAARAARRAERPERAARPERAERPQVSDRANWSARGEQRQQAVQQQQRSVSDRANWSARGEQRQQAVQQQMSDERRGWNQRRANRDGATSETQRQRPAVRTLERSQSANQQRDYRRDGRNRDGSFFGNILDRSQVRDGQVTNRDRDRRYDSRHSGSNRQWSNRWRHDRSYDWRNYRDRNRSIFRLGNYYDPYGSRYRRFSIGFSLFPSYYQSNFWLQDPWMYRLPPAYGPYRWVRYYDDALLVNIYTGQVVDVVHSFFW